MTGEAQLPAPPSRPLPAVRSVLLGLLVVGALGIVGALVSYRADVAEARAQVRERVVRQGQLYADSLALHLAVLRSELKRLASHPDVLAEKADADLLRLERHGADLFGGGVALLDLDGTPRWADPDDLLNGVQPLSKQAWFQRTLAMEDVAVDVLEGPTPRLAIGVPVARSGKQIGLLVGVVDASDKLLFGESTQVGERLLVLGANGSVLLPPKPPGWSHERGFNERVEALLNEPDGARGDLGGQSRFLYAKRIGDSSLRMLLVAAEEDALAPVRGRLLSQLLFLSALQMVTLSVFGVFLRRQYRHTLTLEAALARQEKMAALGQASSLIAHEVKNSLNGLNTAVSLVESGGDAGVASRTLRSQVDRLKHLATSLLSFARPTEPRQVPLRANEIAREAAQGLLSLPELAEVQLKASLETPVEAMGDPLLLVTALDNLIRNAIEASVAARDVGSRTEAKVQVSARRENGAAIVEVEDEAGGPPPGFEKTWGEPFTTTKPKGIGLGLAMARRAIEEQGGALVFHRTEKGSRFTVQLKVAG
jgi:signal transduction histidine kinase